MTMYAKIGSTIQTVIVIAWDMAFQYILFFSMWRLRGCVSQKLMFLQLQAWHLFIQLPSCKGARAPLNPLKCA